MYSMKLVSKLIYKNLLGLKFRKKYPLYIYQNVCDSRVYGHALITSAAGRTCHRPWDHLRRLRIILLGSGTVNEYQTLCRPHTGPRAKKRLCRSAHWLVTAEEKVTTKLCVIY